MKPTTYAITEWPKKNTFYTPGDSSDIGNRSVYARLSHLVLRIIAYYCAQALLMSLESKYQL